MNDKPANYDPIVEELRPNTASAVEYRWPYVWITLPKADLPGAGDNGGAEAQPAHAGD